MKIIVCALISIFVTSSVFAAESWERVKIPADVEKGIKAYAAKEWPGDFAMQLFTVKKERIGFQKMTSFKTQFKADELTMAIIKQAEEDWPDNYEMQVYQFMKQIKAYYELNQS